MLALGACFLPPGPSGGECEISERFMGKCLLAAALAIFVAGGAEAASRLNVVIQPEPPSLMTGIVQNGPTQMVGGSIYESLLRYDKDLKPQASLAKEWSVSPDGLLYTFKL